jgi:hypothetical protein
LIKEITAKSAKNAKIGFQEASFARFACFAVIFFAGGGS